MCKLKKNIDIDMGYNDKAEYVDVVHNDKYSKSDDNDVHKPCQVDTSSATHLPSTVRDRSYASFRHFGLYRYALQLLLSLV